MDNVSDLKPSEEIAAKGEGHLRLDVRVRMAGR
jgi:hypothetical protein